MTPCFAEPLPALYDALRYLDAAVSAHLEGQRDLADHLIRLADKPEVLAWADTMWGAGGPWSRPQSSPSVPEAERCKLRMPSAPDKLTIIARDGFMCRFCGVPVIASDARKALSRLYPDAARWGATNASRHTTLQVLDLQWDHVLPHGRGGASDPSNVLITCAPCNYGRGNLTCEEVGLSDPWARQPSPSRWDGLRRVLS